MLSGMMAIRCLAAGPASSPCVATIPVAMKVSAVILTYYQPAWLEKALHGWVMQSHVELELVIADDGSDHRTREVVERFQALAPFPVLHVWHEDRGFRKSRILNLATMAASGDYLIFADGDCIPRRDFVAVHVNHSAPRCFLSGGYCKLPMDLSQRLTREQIESGIAFDPVFLRRGGLKDWSPTVKLAVPERLRPLMDVITPRKATWNGCNSSTWKSEVLAVNGHHEGMAYGGEDREMGERLVNRGLVGKQIQHRALLLHLDHDRSYKIPEDLRRNMEIRREVVEKRITWCPEGITKNGEA